MMNMRMLLPKGNNQ